MALSSYLHTEGRYKSPETGRPLILSAYRGDNCRIQLPGSHHSLVRAPHNQRIRYRRFQTFHFSALPLQWDGVSPGKFLDRAEYRIPDERALGWPGEIFVST